MPSLTRAEMKTSGCFILRVGFFISLQEQRSPNPPVFSSAPFPSWEDRARVPQKPTGATLPPDKWGSCRTESQGLAASVAPTTAPTLRCRVYLCASKRNTPRREQADHRSTQAALKRAEATKYTPSATSQKGLSGQSVETPRDA